MTIAADRLPVEYRSDIDRAVRILRQGGCTEVHLFGSIGFDAAISCSDGALFILRNTGKPL